MSLPVRQQPQGGFVEASPADRKNSQQNLECKHRENECCAHLDFDWEELKTNVFTWSAACSNMCRLGLMVIMIIMIIDRQRSAWDGYVYKGMDGRLSEEKLRGEDAGISIL